MFIPTQADVRKVLVLWCLNHLKMPVPPSSNLTDTSGRAVPLKCVKIATPTQVQDWAGAVAAMEEVLAVGAASVALVAVGDSVAVAATAADLAVEAVTEEEEEASAGVRSMLPSPQTPRTHSQISLPPMGNEVARSTSVM
jgi:hypothetical protein